MTRIHRTIFMMTAVAFTNALPHRDHMQRLHQSVRSEAQFTVTITNSCPEAKSFGTYQITPEFQVLQLSSPTVIEPGGQNAIQVPFHATGVRLSGNADWPLADQWNPQALVEFGYSVYSGEFGTAYDLSFMPGSDPTIGASVAPTNSACETKLCKTPTDCPPGQGWTDAGQSTDGSPADTVCYHGMTSFVVAWCP